MTTETDQKTCCSTRCRPLAITIFGLLIIAFLIAMPFLAGKPDAEKTSDIVRFFGHFHPVVLHLPIGIFSLIIFQELLAMFSRYRPQPTLIPIFAGAASSVVAVLFGFLLYIGGGYEMSELLGDHLWGGIFFACAAILTLIVKAWFPQPTCSQVFYRVMLFGSVAIMGYASHDGASITHGEDYLFEYAPNPIRKVFGYEPKVEIKDAPDKPLEEQIVYADIVQPILNKRCVECHKEGKSKGKFRMDSYELLVKGGKEGDGITPGDSAKSNIVYRCELPEDDDEHMPPESKTDIEDHELAVIKWWIDSGADPMKTVAQLNITDEIRAAVSKLGRSIDPKAGKSEGATQAKQDLPSDALLKSVASLSKDFPGGLTFESQASAKLTFTAVSLRSNLNDEVFAKLKTVIPSMVSMDLSSTAITDNSVKLLASAKDLRMIRLSETKISDASLDTLATLKNLESINLYGTRVSDAGVEKLKSLPQLKRLYLWQTDVSAGMIEKLKQALPGVEIITGI
ncbi:MAG: c-type cytochrome domain-containing protein [Verrucomicrobiota bacterium]